MLNSSDLLFLRRGATSHHGQKPKDWIPAEHMSEIGQETGGIIFVHVGDSKNSTPRIV